MMQDLVTEGLPCLKRNIMHQTAMAQGICTASSKAIVAAAAAAPATAALPVQQFAAGRDEECCKGQATNSACHSAGSLVGALAYSAQSAETHMLAVRCWQLSQLHSLAVCNAVHHCWVRSPTPNAASLPLCLLARRLDSIVSDKSSRFLILLVVLI